MSEEEAITKLKKLIITMEEFMQELEKSLVNENKDYFGIHSILEQLRYARNEFDSKYLPEGE